MALKPTPKGDSGGQWPALIPQGHLQGRPPIPLKRVLTVIGEIKTAHIHLHSKNKLVSQVHAVLVCSDHRLYVRDIASRTRVFVNGKAVREADLHDGDTLKIGEFVFGIQIAQEAEEPAQPVPEAVLEIDGEDLPLMLSTRTTIIGRRATCDLPIANEALSTVHAIIFECNGRRMIRDFYSRAGTFVNGQRVHQAELNIGDEITAGPVAMKYQSAAPEEAATSDDAPLARAPIVLDNDALPVGDSHIGADLADLTGDTAVGHESMVAPSDDTAVGHDGAPREDPVPAPDLMPATEEAAAEQLAPIPIDEEPVAPVQQEAEVVPVGEVPVEEPAAVEETPAPIEPEIEPIAVVPEPPLNVEEPVVVVHEEPAKVEAPIDIADKISIAETDARDDAAAEQSPPLILDLPAEVDSQPIATAKEYAPEVLPPAAKKKKQPKRSERKVKSEEIPPEDQLPAIPTLDDPGIGGLDFAVPEIDFAGMELPTSKPTAPAPTYAAPVADAELPALDFGGDVGAIDFGLPAGGEALPALDFGTDAPAMAPMPTADVSLPKLDVAEPVIEQEAPIIAEEIPALPPIDVQQPVVDEQIIAADAPLAVDEIPALPPVDILPPEDVVEAPPVVEAAPVVEESIPVAPEIEPEAAAPAPEPVAVEDSIPMAPEDVEPEAPVIAPEPVELEESLPVAEEPVAEALAVASEAAVVEEFIPLAPDTEPEPAAPEPIAEAPMPVEEIVEEEAIPAEIDSGPASEPIADAPTEIAPEPSSVDEADEASLEPIGIEPPADVIHEEAVQEEVVEAEAITQVEHEPAIEELPIERGKVEEPQVTPEPAPVDEADDESFEAVDVEPPTDVIHEGPVQEEVAEPEAVAEVGEIEPQAMPEEVESGLEPMEIAAEESEPALSEDEATEFLSDMGAQPGAIDEAPAPSEVSELPPIEESAPAVEEIIEEAPVAPIEPPKKPKRRWWPFGKRKKAEVREELFGADASPDLDVPVEPIAHSAQSLQEQIQEQSADDEVLIPQDVLPPEELADEQAGITEEPQAEIVDTIAASEAFGSQADIEEPADRELPIDVALTSPVQDEQQEAPPLEEMLHAEEKTEVEAPPHVEPEPEAPLGSLTGPLDIGTADLSYLGGMPLDLNHPLPQEAPAQAQPPQHEPPPQVPVEEVEEPVAATPPPPVAPAPTPPRPKQPMKIPPRPRLPSMNEPVGPDTILPGLDADFSSSPSVEAFQGLAMPPVRDVFSSMPTPAPDDPFLGQKKTVDDASSEPEAQVAEPIDPAHPDESAPAEHPGDNGAPAEDENDFFFHPGNPTAKRPISAIAPAREVSTDRKLPGVRVLLGFMLLCMIASTALVWFLVPPQYKVEGKLKFKDFAGLSTRQKESLRREQRQLLGDPGLRATAAQIVEANKIDAGFLGDGETFVRALSDTDHTLWPDDSLPTADTLVFTMDSRAPDADRARVKALLVALYNTTANQASIAQVSKNVEIRGLTTQIDNQSLRIKTLTAQMDEQKKLVDAAPTDTQYETLKNTVAQRRSAWENGQATVLQLREQIKQLKNASTQPAPATQAEDPQLAQLAAQLDAARKQLMAAKSSSRTGLAEARGAYDQAVLDFQKQTETFQEKAKNVPELRAYANAASDLKETARSLANELLQSQKDQKDQLDRLVDLKNRMEEKLQARRLEMWNSDPELKDLNERLALATRKYNASSSAEPNRQQDLDALKKDMDGLKAQVAVRQKALGDDNFYAETISQLEKDIATGQRHLAENAVTAEEARVRFEDNLKKLLPVGDNLPAAQRTLASGLQRSVKEMDEARKQYLVALEPGSSDGSAVAHLQGNIMDLQSKIESRKQEIEAAKPKISQDERARLAGRMILKKQGELTAAEKLADDAENSLLKAQGELTLMNNARSVAKGAGDARDRYASQIKELEEARAGVMSKMTAQTAEARSIASPEEPTADNVNSYKVDDPRIKYILASWGGIVLVFVLLIFISSQVTEAEDRVGFNAGSMQQDPREPLQV